MEDRDVFEYVEIHGPVDLTQIMGHFNRHDIRKLRDELNEAIRDGDYVRADSIANKILGLTRRDRHVSASVHRLINQDVLTFTLDWKINVRQV